MVKNFFEIRFQKQERDQRCWIYARDASEAIEKVQRREPLAVDVRITKDVFGPSMPKQNGSRSIWSLLHKHDAGELREDLRGDNSPLALSLAGRGDTGGRPPKADRETRIGPIVVRDR